MKKRFRIKFAFFLIVILSYAISGCGTNYPTVAEQSDNQIETKSQLGDTEFEPDDAQLEQFE